MKLQWRALTRFHDWSLNDRAQLRSLVEQARQLGVLGEISWYTDPKDERLPAGPEVSLERLLAGKAKRHRSWGFEVGGEHPRPWQLSVLLARWNEPLSQLYGYNSFGLWFESEPFEGETGSERLISAFRHMHTAQNTEFAFIHPNQRESELTDVSGPYSAPLTLGPMFAGVFWANFLGPRHLTFFDEAKLRSLSAYRFEHVPQTSLFVQVSPDVAQATSDEVEAEMLRLTEAFRAALR
jgi:hypothetical protein